MVNKRGCTRTTTGATMRPRGACVWVANVLAIGGVMASANALAADDASGSDLEVKWSLGSSLGTSWRASGPDSNLISQGNGGTAAGNENDNANLNFRKGKPFSTVLNVIGDLNISRDNYGLFVRAKAWNDFTLKNGSVPHGSYANGFVPGAELSDAQFDRLSKFSGVALLDAYVYGTFDLPGSKPLTLKLGNQVVNWGESLFFPGVNQFGAFDITAAHRPGAQVKEIMLPVPQIFGSLALTENSSLEGFYQFKWKKYVLDGCGTYWSPSSIINCSSQGNYVGNGALSDAMLYGGVPSAALGLPSPPFGAVTNFRMGLMPEKQPGDSGQWGLAYRLRAPTIDTDIGLYYAQYSTHLPNLSTVLTPTTIKGSAWALLGNATFSGTQAMLDYSAKDIKVAAVSASTLIGGWSVMGELSHTANTPVQINGNDFVNGIASGVGPLAALHNSPNGAYLRGYDLKSKTQLQVSTVQAFSQVLGAESLTFIGEVAAQHWSGIGDPGTSTRYGRDFIFGSGPIGGSAAVCAAVNGTANTSYCENKGYYTSSAWGYRVLLEATYSNVFYGVNAKPRLFIAHDVKGYSADGLLVEKRITLSPGVRFDYAKKYYLDLSYARYNKAKYDLNHDKAFFSVVMGVNF